MGLFKRLMGRMGYVKLAEYGLELTGDRVVPIDEGEDVDDDPDIVEGPFAIGSITDGEPARDYPVIEAVERQMRAENLGEADTLKVIVDPALDVEADTAKFLEADTIPAKKI